MICPYCQKLNPAEAKFCMSCGAALAGNSRQDNRGESDTRPARSLDRLIPRELLTKFEAARVNDAMVGERRVITMMFCDVSGSTAAAEKVDPETWTEIINGIFEHMIRPIYRYEGTVPRLMGDAILAFFGAPIAHEDDPQRAVLAGLEIQEEIKPFIEHIRENHRLDLGLRVGINTGLVVVGQIGSDLRMEYTAIGDAINLAARMEQTAESGTVQISEETYKLVAPFFEFQALGEIEVKGKSAPVRTFRPLALRKAPGRLRGIEGVASPLVGREAQLTLLNEQLDLLDQGTGSFVTVIGEAGLGKSALVGEIQKARAVSGHHWLRGEALSYAHSVSYFPWRQVIRQSIDAQDGDSAAEIRGKLHYGCECCRLPGGDIPFLEAMLAVESKESLQTVAGYQGEVLVQMIRDATQGYLCALANERPLVIVLDDLHWADEASMQLLVHLAELTGNHAMLFICMLRPDPAAPAWDVVQTVQATLQERCRSIVLDPLRADQTEALVSHLLGMQELPADVHSLIVEKAQGNPFFVEELLRSLIETKQITRENNHWRIVNQTAKVSLPNTLRGVLSARIDRLAEATKHVLQNAAVIGRSFDLRVLRKLTGLNGSLDAHIESLQQANLIEPAREEYAFRHVLIQESAYDSILIKKRIELHRRIGELLEELHADRIDAFAPLVAHHFYNARDPRSFKYDTLAGEKAARLYANAEAATHFSRALEVARRGQMNIEQVVDLYIRLGAALELSGRYEQALANYEAMHAFGREQADRSVEFSALMGRATIYSTYTRLHDPALAEQTLLQALQISREMGNRLAQARLNWNLMLTYLFSSRLDQALEHGERALALARESGDREQLAFVLNDLCRLFVCRGEFKQALVVIGEARELWQSLNNQTMLADSLGSEAEARFNRGEHTTALGLLEQGLRLSEETKNLWGRAYNRMLISFIKFDRGEIGAAIRLSSEAIADGDRAGLVASATSHRAELGWYYGYYGDIEKGLELARQALLVAEQKQPAFKALPQAVIVRLYLLKGDLESAEEAAGPELLGPIPIPYSRYRILVHLANVELALAQKDYTRALRLAEDLLAQVMPLTRVDIPMVMRRKADALIGLSRLEAAHQILTEAGLLAGRSGSQHHLWFILSGLADVCALLGKHQEAEKFRMQARSIVEWIAGGLREVGLTQPFLERPQIRELMR